MDPTSMSPGSIMPAYDWLGEQILDTTTTVAKINAMRTLGVPYAPLYEQQANSDLKKQAEGIVASLAKDNIRVNSDKEIIAIIAYLQRLGTDIKVGNMALQPSK
jgi:cytochrome c oxidase cbb3-type subunit I/II